MPTIKTITVSKRMRVKLQPEDFEDCEAEQFRSCNIELNEDEEYLEEFLQGVKDKMTEEMRRDLELDMEYAFREFFSKKAPHLSKKGKRNQ